MSGTRISTHCWTDHVAAGVRTGSRHSLDATAVELPRRVKQALKLDEARSWVVIDEVNQFVWPGHDIRPVPGTADRFAHGHLPPGLFDDIVARLLVLIEKRRVGLVRRD